MLDVKALLAQGETLVQELDTLRGKALESTTDEDKKAVAGAVAEKEKEWEGLQGKVQEAKAHAAKQRVLDDLRGLGAPATSTLSVVEPMGVVAGPAQAINHAAAERARSEGVLDYMAGKSLSGEMYKELRPRSPKFEGGAEGISLPRSVVGRIFGKRVAGLLAKSPQEALDLQGKENPLTSAGTGFGEASLIPQDFRAQMLELPTEPTYILNLATVVSGTTGTITWPRLVQADGSEYGGVVFTWINEGAAKPETRPEFEQLEIDAHELAGHTQITLRMLARSAINLEAYLAGLYRGSALNVLDTAFLTGTGIGQPLGIVNDVAVRTQPRATAMQVNYEDLVRMKHRLMGYHRGNARWFIDDTVEAYLELIRTQQYAADATAGRPPLFSATVATGPYDRLIGYPYITTERQPDLGTDGDVIYGDWRQYIVNMEQEVVIKRSDHAEFVKNVAVFVLYLVVGGRAAHGRAFCYLREGAS